MRCLVTRLSLVISVPTMQSNNFTKVEMSFFSNSKVILLSLCCRRKFSVGQYVLFATLSIDLFSLLVLNVIFFFYVRSFQFCYSLLVIILCLLLNTCEAQFYSDKVSIKYP